MHLLFFSGIPKYFSPFDSLSHPCVEEQALGSASSELLPALCRDLWEVLVRSTWRLTVPLHKMQYTPGRDLERSATCKTSRLGVPITSLFLTVLLVLASQRQAQDSMTS